MEDSILAELTEAARIRYGPERAEALKKSLETVAEHLGRLAAFPIDEGDTPAPWGEGLGAP